MISHQTVKPHQHSHPAQDRRLRMTLDEVTYDRGPRRAVEEYNLCMAKYSFAHVIKLLAIADFTSRHCRGEAFHNATTPN